MMESVKGMGNAGCAPLGKVVPGGLTEKASLGQNFEGGKEIKR